MDLLHLSDHQTYWQQKCESLDLLGDDHSPIINVPQSEARKSMETKARKSRDIPLLLLEPYISFPGDHSYIPTTLSERQVRLGQTMCTALTEGAQSPGLKAWRLSEIQCSSKKLSSAAVTLATKPYHQLKSKVEVLEMAAVLIKQIYSIDINSCFTTIVPV